MVAPPNLPRPVVLVVDDEPVVRSTLQLGLHEQFEIECASSTKEAELMLATRSYDVIICDYLMPGEDGLPFLIRMRKLYPRLPRILLTSYINPEMLSRSTGLAGLAACLIKPVAKDELITAIRQALKT